jgi:hypothetical protein
VSPAPAASSVTSAEARLPLRLDVGRFGRWVAPVSVAVAICVVGIALSGFHKGFPATWVLGSGVPNWFDRLNNWVSLNQSSNFFLSTIIGGIGNVLNSATNDLVNGLHWLSWLGVLTLATLAAWLVGRWRAAVFAAVMVAS